MKVGFIGCGNMGRTIVRYLIDSGTLQAEDVTVSNRSEEKLEALKRDYSNLTVTTSNQAVAQQSEMLFLCVRSTEVLNVLREVKDSLSDEVHLVLINAGVQIEHVETVFSGKITKMIPSVTLEVRRGVTLICHNQRVSTANQECVERMFAQGGLVKVIPEKDFEMGTDLTSCAPGFIACIFNEFVKSAAALSDFTAEEITEMLLCALHGTTLLLIERNIGFQDLIETVATKGGITEEGVKVFKSHLPETFKEVLLATTKKHELVKQSLAKQYLPS